MVGMSKKNPLGKSARFVELILCSGIDCTTAFQPKRKDQAFCSPHCRMKYFSTARNLGVILLEESRYNPELKLIANRLLKHAL
jgi:hypothetical protein